MGIESKCAAFLVPNVSAGAGFFIRKPIELEIILVGKESRYVAFLVANISATSVSRTHRVLIILAIMVEL